MTLKFTQETNPDISTIKAIEDGLVAYNKAAAGSNSREALWLVGRDENGDVQAGLKGNNHFNWLFVDWLWVAEESRNHNYGSDLLSLAEQIARDRGCAGVFLYTYSFQAPGFYAKHGYKEFGRLDNLPVNQSLIYLSKTFEKPSS